MWIGGTDVHPAMGTSRIMAATYQNAARAMCADIFTDANPPEVIRHDASGTT